MADNNTPFREATSIITIGSVLIAVAGYVGTIHGMPGLAAGILWVGGYICAVLPVIPIWAEPLAGSAGVGLLCYIVSMPLATLLAKRLAASQLQNVERHTDELKRTRAKIQKKERIKDDFIVR